MFKVFLVTTSLLVPAATSAQEFSGGVTLGFSQSDIDAIPFDVDGISFDGRIAVELGSGFTFGARFNQFNMDVDSTPVSVDGQMIGLDLDYAFSANGSVGAFVENAEVGLDIGVPIGLNVSATTFGIEGHYTSGALDFGGFIAVSEPGGLLPSDIDMRHFGLSLKYAPTEALTIGASAIRTNVDAFGTDIDVDYIGLAGVYSVNERISLFGGVSRTTLDIVDADVTTVGLGGAYDLSAMAGMPMAVSLELARSDFSAGGVGSTDVDTVRLGLTIPLGGKAAKAPLNSTADAILNPSHSAISQTVLNF
ncbi:MAG: porin [Rhodobacter sp.]|nr:porin [Rhodobacter sp.]